MPPRPSSFSMVHLPSREPIMMVLLRRVKAPGRRRETDRTARQHTPPAAVFPDPRADRLPLLFATPLARIGAEEDHRSWERPRPCLRFVKRELPWTISTGSRRRLS